MVQGLSRDETWLERERENFLLFSSFHLLCPFSSTSLRSVKDEVDWNTDLIQLLGTILNPYNYFSSLQLFCILVSSLASQYFFPPFLKLNYPFENYIIIISLHTFQLLLSVMFVSIKYVK